MYAAYLSYQQIKYKRILELQTGLHGSAVIKPRPKFRDFFADLASEKIRFDNNAGNWASAFKHVLVFLGDDTLLSRKLTSSGWKNFALTYLKLTSEAVNQDSAQMAEAKNLLTEGEMNIAEISRALGFDNPTYFSRLFKKG